MTAIYAYTSPQRKMSIILADNVEGNSGKRVDKISLIANRFAVAVYGQDSINDSINSISSFEGTTAELSIPGAFTLANLIAKYANIAMPYMKKLYLDALESGDITQADWDMVLKNGAQTVILDLKEHAIFNVSYGSCFSSIPLSASTIRLSDGMVHRFALATKGSIVDDNRAITGDLDQIISNFKNFLNNDKRRITILGGPGTCVYRSEADIVFESAFLNPEELIASNWENSFLGFKINVIQA